MPHRLPKLPRQRSATAMAVPAAPYARVKQFLHQALAQGQYAPGQRMPSEAELVAQFGVAIYGGYFGAGAGIVMLATLGFMGLTNIHQMNGLKNWGGVCFNGVAALMFVVMGLVNWPIAIAMAIGSTIGGYATAGLARRAPQSLIRGLVAAIGFGSSVWLFVKIARGA
jgi:uncharacterized membrane protein YfcA